MSRKLGAVDTRRKANKRRARSVPVVTPARLAMMTSGYTYRAVAALVGVTDTMIYHVVRGTARTPWVREAIAELLKRDPRELWPDYEPEEQVA